MITYQKQSKSSPEQAIARRQPETAAQLGNDQQTSPDAQEIADLETLVSQIADMLGELRPVPMAQIKILLLALGRPVVFALLRETLKIELQGGMMTVDGSRRRTPGGVFFLLSKKYNREYRRFMRRRKKEMDKAKQRLQRAALE